MERKFEKHSAKKENYSNFNKLEKRELLLYKREGDIRNEFLRDYCRILHCPAFRRLKHKTQVFSAPSNDHICTRIEHVNHVDSVSYVISQYLGLNTDLTNAIAIGHDLGHAPFGHQGEEVLKNISEEKIKQPFWHGKIWQRCFRVYRMDNS
ncbi:MAG: hypothetical protein ACOC5T_03225 [Elusimicrobiota bacterium]